MTYNPFWNQPNTAGANIGTGTALGCACGCTWSISNLSNVITNLMLKIDQLEKDIKELKQK